MKRPRPVYLLGAVSIALLAGLLYQTVRPGVATAPTPEALVLRAPVSPTTIVPSRTPTPTATPEPTSAIDPTWGIEVPWIVNCDDENPYNGYMNQEVCVPGWVSWESSHFRNPRGFAGAMSSYAQGVMQIVCENRGLPCSKYRGVAAVMGCGNIGNTAYLRRPGGEWYGPLLIVDCTGQKDAFVNILVKQIAIEVDYETARKMGSLTIGWVEVRVNSGGVAGGYNMSLAWWWKTQMLSFVWPGVQPTPSLTPTPERSTMTPTQSPIE